MTDYTKDNTKDNIFYKEGRSARKVGIKKTDCPYNTPQIKERWDSGWNDEDAKQMKLGSNILQQLIRTNNMPEISIDRSPGFLSAQRSYENMLPVEDNTTEETEKSIEELLAETSQERYLEAVKFIKETVSNLEVNYLLTCIYDGLKLADYKKFEAELRIKLGDERLKNYLILKDK